MKLNLLAILLLATVSTGALANSVEEKKAIAASDAKAATDGAAIKAACGNADLKITIDWASYEALPLENGNTKENIFSQPARLTEKLAADFATICADKDYKAEVAKLTEIKLVPNNTHDPHWTNFKHEGTVMTVAFNQIYNIGDYDIKAIKDTF